jgi:phosphatidylinositol dimannoside acyltransferase
VRVAPPVVGLAICAVATERRRAIASNLRRIRGAQGPLRETADVVRTFATYASCLAEVLGADRGRLPDAVVHGAAHVRDALAAERGLLVVTAHTAGWETIGRLLARDLGRRVMVVEAAEGDAAASAIQDDARRAQGLLVTHVGDDPVAALGLLRHLRERGVVALQVDRVPRAMRARGVTMFGEASRVPEGPLRLAALTGAPIVPIFAARTGHRRYEIIVYPPIRLARSAGDSELDAAAQGLAAAIQEFVRARPTQWFHFRRE